MVPQIFLARHSPAVVATKFLQTLHELKRAIYLLQPVMPASETVQPLLRTSSENNQIDFWTH